MTRHLADILARDILNDITDEICRDETLRRRVADRLRDELAAIEHRMFSEIRVADANDTPDDPAPQPKFNQKGGLT
jgi:hypothetical protein